MQNADNHNILNMITDTHAHYDDKSFDADRDDLLLSMKDKNVGTVIHAAASLESNRYGLALCDKYPFMKTMLGLHPDDIGDISDEFVAWMKETASDPRVVAIGEIGLDYHWNVRPKGEQKEGFMRMIEVAREAELPICVHSREAKEDTLEILKEAEKLGVNGVVHCYSYDAKTSTELINMGFYIGVGGVLTYKKADDLVATVTQIPLDKIVLETDAPYLAPVPFRGKRNDSSYIKYVAEKLAELRNLKTEEVIRITSENARKIYPKLTA